MPRVASSAEAVPRSRIRELAEIAMSMDGVLRLYFGESNLPTPAYIKQAAARALDEGYTFYTENAGLPSLRQAIAENYRRLHAVELDPATEIVVTASGVQALNLGIRCALDPLDDTNRTCERVARASYEAGLKALKPGIAFADLVVSAHTTGVADITVSRSVSMPPTVAKLAMPAWSVGGDFAIVSRRHFGQALNASKVFAILPNTAALICATGTTSAAAWLMLRKKETSL